MTPEEVGQKHRLRLEEAQWDIMLRDGKGRVVKQTSVGGNVSNYTFNVSWIAERVLIYLCITAIAVTYIAYSQ